MAATTQRVTGSTPLYAHLYTPHSPFPSFYLPDAHAPLPATTAHAPCSAAQLRAHGIYGRRGGGRGRVAAGGASGQMAIQEEEFMLALEDDEKAKQEDSAQVIVMDDLLTALRSERPAMELSKSTQALLSVLEDTPVAEGGSEGETMLSALKRAVHECEKAVGLDMIRLSMRMVVDFDEAETDEEMMRAAIMKELQASRGILTLSTLHECGLSFILRVALPTSSITSGSAQRLGVERDVLQHLSQEKPRDAPKKASTMTLVKLSSSSAPSDGATCDWLLLERPMHWMPIREALMEGLLTSDRDLPDLNAQLQALLRSYSRLELPTHLHEQMASLSLGAADMARRGSGNSDSSSHPDDADEELHRGRQPGSMDALAIPSTSAHGTSTPTGDASATGHRSDSAVAGLGFSPRDERHVVAMSSKAPMSSGMTAATLQLHPSLASRAVGHKFLLDYCYYDSRRNQGVITRIPDVRFM